MVEYKKYKTNVIMLDIYLSTYTVMCMYGGISSVGFDSLE